MKYRSLRSVGVVVAMVILVAGMARVIGMRASVQQTSGPDAAPAPQTPWGEPDLEGIWSVELLVPLERPDGVTTEFYTEEEVAELEAKERLAQQRYEKSLEIEKKRRGFRQWKSVFERQVATGSGPSSTGFALAIASCFVSRTQEGTPAQAREQYLSSAR